MLRQVLLLSCVMHCYGAQTTSYDKSTPYTTVAEYATTGTTEFVTTDATDGCCGQVDILEAQVASLQAAVTELQEQMQRVETALNFTDAQRSCDEYRAMGFSSGSYTIDPDGPEGDSSPFDVYCDMDTDPDWAITIMGHDSEDRTFVNGCQNPGCYSHDVTYDQSLSQIEAVMRGSENCWQYLSYECIGSMLFNFYDFAWWVSRDGVSQYYWPGADPGSKMCACGKNGTCEGESTTCNCDNNDYVWRQDDGYLTSKDTLPVTQLNFGDVLGVEERGYFTLGKLQCKGKVITTDCAGLKLSGYSSGYHEISPQPDVEPFTVYCDMDSYPLTGITVFHHDQEDKTNVNSYYDGTEDVPVTYTNVTMEQITAVINRSAKCEQYIEWQCYRTGMLYSDYIWWTSRQGEKMTYWGGATPNHSGYCACGETGSCQPGNDYNYKCNCDEVYNYGWRVDGGNLYDKSVLPVTQMHFSFYTTSSNYYGYYTLGTLNCY